MAVLVFLVLFLALTGYSSASYCLCKDGLSDAVLQKTIDYACGSGADCSQILQNGPCFQPNTIKDHCSYAANSYYQKKVSAGATCDFSGTATLSASPPAGATSTCVYPSSSGTSGTPTTGTPTTTPTTGTPTTPTTGTPTTPTTTPTTGTTTPTTGTTTPTPSVFGTGTGTGLGPTGSGFDNSGVGSLKGTHLVYTSVGLWWVSGLVLLWA